MKTTLEIVKMATQLRTQQTEQDKESDPTIYYYTHGQVQVLEFIINGQLLPEDMETELNTMYSNSIHQFKNWGSHQVNDQNIYAELCGAADILAWVLDLAEETHKANTGVA